MFSSSSLRLVRLFGIRIGVHPSWFLILFLFVFLLSDSFTSVMGGNSNAGYATALAATVLFFSSIVLHELGHAFAARRSGIEVRGIDLIFFGGIMHMSRDTDTPGSEFKVAIAGPLVTFLLICLGTGVGMALSGPEDFWRTASLTGDHADVATLLVSFLVTMNVVLLAFNLVPAFPLDGGRVARAIIWKITGDRPRSTRLAARIGEWFGYGLIAVGLGVSVSGSFFDGLWLIILGWFLAQAARAAIFQSELVQRLAQVSVADIMDSDPVTLDLHLSPEEALHQYFDRYYSYDTFAVVDSVGEFRGILTRDQVRQAVEDDPSKIPAIDPLIEATDDEITISESASLETLISSSELYRWGLLVVLDEKRNVLGVVSRDQVAAALKTRVPDLQGPR